MHGAVARCSTNSATPPPHTPSISPRHSLEEKIEILQVELTRIDELLEIEPDCRWALLARMRLQQALAAPDEAVSNLERMSTLDPLRRNFYADSKANALMQQRLITWSQEGRGDLKLVGLGLRHISPTAAAFTFGVRVLRLEENDLQEFGPLLQLLSLIDLSISKNRLRGDVSEIFCLNRLQRVDLSWNCLSFTKKEPPEKLQEMDLSGNPKVLGNSELPHLFPANWKLHLGEDTCLAQKAP